MSHEKIKTKLTGIKSLDLLPFALKEYSWQNRWRKRSPPTHKVNTIGKYKSEKRFLKVDSIDTNLLSKEDLKKRLKALKKVIKISTPNKKQSLRASDKDALQPLSLKNIKNVTNGPVPIYKFSDKGSRRTQIGPIISLNRKFVVNKAKQCFAKSGINGRHLVSQQSNLHNSSMKSDCKLEISKKRKAQSKYIKNGHNKLEQLLAEYEIPKVLRKQIQVLSLVGEGSFGKVFKCRDRLTNKSLALKRVVQDNKYRNRELNIVKLIDNDFVIKIKDARMTYSEGEKYLNILMDFYQENLFQRCQDRTRLNSVEFKIILYQIFLGLAYIHSISICHRDIKPENVLLNGLETVLCDFGSAKILQDGQNNIPYICSRCYRAPELIFGSILYTTIIDIWSAGCLILEVLHGKPLFMGNNSLDHIIEVINVMGSPSIEEVISMNPNYNIDDYNFPNIKKKQWSQLFPQCDPLLLDLIDKIMVYDPSKRLTAQEVLYHYYFSELREPKTLQHLAKQYHLPKLLKCHQMTPTQHESPQLIPK